MPHPEDFVAKHPGRRGAPGTGPASTATWWPTARLATSSTPPATRAPTAVQGHRVHAGAARQPTPATADGAVSGVTVRRAHRPPRAACSSRARSPALDRRRAGGARRALRRRRHRLLGREPHRHVRGLPRHQARGRHVQAVGPLPGRRRLPEVPHQAGRLQLLHPQPAGRHQPHPVRVQHVPAPDHHLCGHQQLRAVPPQVADRARPGRRQHPRQPHGPARGRLPVPDLPRRTSRIRARSSRWRASRRTRCRSARAATTARSSPTTATSATSAAFRRGDQRRDDGATSRRRSAPGATSSRTSAPSATTACTCRTRRAGEEPRRRRPRPRQEHLRLLPPQEGPDVLHRLPRAARCRIPAAGRRSHGSYAPGPPQQKCVKCHGQDSCISCHGLQMPHPAAGSRTHPSVALDPASAPSATAARSASPATASSCRTAAPSSPTTRTTCTTRAACA